MNILLDFNIILVFVWKVYLGPCQINMMQFFLQKQLMAYKRYT